MRVKTGNHPNVPQAQQLDRSESARVTQNFIGNVITASDAFWRIVEAY